MSVSIHRTWPRSQHSGCMVASWPQSLWSIWNPTSKNNGNVINGYCNIKTNTSAFSATRKREKRLNCFVEFDLIRLYSWPASLTLWRQILRWFVTLWIRYDWPLPTPRRAKDLQNRHDNPNSSTFRVEPNTCALKPLSNGLPQTLMLWKMRVSSSATHSFANLNKV